MPKPYIPGRFADLMIGDLWNMVEAQLRQQEGEVSNQL
jgi:hypothetical protein